MNQEQNNFNQNNFNLQGNNGISNNQPSNNQNFNKGVSDNQSILSTNNSQPINQMNMQESTPQSMNIFESESAKNQSFNNKPQKKINLGLIICIVSAIVMIIVVIAVIILLNNSNKNNVDENYNNSVENNSDENTNINYDENGAFLLRVEDMFTITGRGTIVTGTVERGTVKVNDEVQIIGLDKEIITTTVAGIEMLSKSLDYATIGDNVGILLRGVERDQVQTGQVVAEPNSITATKKFDADLSVLSTEEGGRTTSFFDGYSPEFNFKTDIKGTINLPEDIQMVNPGEDVRVTVTLTTAIAVDPGTKFSIREGERTIANGIVTKVY